jgi:heme-degrading monooxygenase HmoA
MEKIRSYPTTLMLGILFMFPAKGYSQINNSKAEIEMETIQSSQKMDTMEKVFVDKFFVPKNARNEFYERANINRNFIKKQAGFIKDNVYERVDENGDFSIVTVAVWENDEAIKNAKQAVQAEYKREGFDMQSMLRRLNIVIDRGVYKKTSHSKAQENRDTTAQIFIDKFFVPQKAKQEYEERAKISRNFIRKLPGFIEDNVYERTDEQGNNIVITIAELKNVEALQKAKDAVKAEYKKEGFDMQGMFKRLHITVERGVYGKILK